MRLSISSKRNISILIILIIFIALICNEFLEKKFHPLVVIAGILFLFAIVYLTLSIISSIISFTYKFFLSIYSGYIGIKHFFLTIKKKPINTLKEDFTIENMNKIIIKVFNNLLNCNNDSCYLKMMVVIFSIILAYWLFIPLYIYYKYIKRLDKYLCFCNFCKINYIYGSEICNQCGRLLPCYYEEKINKKYYKILESSRNNSDDEIKNNYRRLVKIYHPDKLSRDNTSDITIKEAEDKLKELNNAYENIKAYRKIYNSI